MSSMSLNDLTDVTISNPIIDQKIAYDGIQWTNYYAKILLAYETYFQGSWGRKSKKWENQNQQKHGKIHQVVK